MVHLDDPGVVDATQQQLLAESCAKSSLVIDVNRIFTAKTVPFSPCHPAAPSEPVPASSRLTALNIAA